MEEQIKIDLDQAEQQINLIRKTLDTIRRSL